MTGESEPLCAAARATTSNTLKVTDGDMFGRAEIVICNGGRENDCHYVEAKRATKVISAPECLDARARWNAKRDIPSHSQPIIRGPHLAHPPRVQCCTFFVKPQICRQSNST